MLTQFVTVLSSPASLIFLERTGATDNSIVFDAQMGHM